MQILPDSVPVDIQDHLNGRVFLQNGRDAFQGMIIGPAAVQLPVHQIINAGIVDHPVPLCLQKLCQIIPDPHHCGLGSVGPVVRERFLGVGVVNKDLGIVPIRVKP